MIIRYEILVMKKYGLKSNKIIKPNRIIKSYKWSRIIPAYGVYISQLIRYWRTCNSYQDFLHRPINSFWIKLSKTLNWDLHLKFVTIFDTPLSWLNDDHG